jgi:hypothetical protein
MVAVRKYPAGIRVAIPCRTVNRRDVTSGFRISERLPVRLGPPPRQVGSCIAERLPVRLVAVRKYPPTRQVACSSSPARDHNFLVGFTWIHSDLLGF